MDSICIRISITTIFIILYKSSVSIYFIEAPAFQRIYNNAKHHDATIAAGFATFVMVITKTEHPPAAARALGLVLNERDMLTFVVVIVGVIALSIFRRLVLPILMDLL